MAVLGRQLREDRFRGLRAQARDRCPVGRVAIVEFVHRLDGREGADGGASVG